MQRAEYSEIRIHGARHLVSAVPRWGRKLLSLIMVFE